VTARNGAASVTASTVNGGQRVRRRLATVEDPFSRNFSQRKILAVTDGRLALGTIEIADGVFTSITIEGETIGMFRTLREASRAFDNRGRIL
jgi:hypothetical protein